MKLLVNRKIKRLFLCVLLTIAAFTAASVFIVFLKQENAVHYVLLAAVLTAVVVFAALFWYFRNQSKISGSFMLSCSYPDHRKNSHRNPERYFL